MAYFYTDFDAAMAAIDVAVADCEADNPELAGSDDVYHDMAQAIMYDCAPDIRREVSRCTGVAQPRR